MNWWVAMIIGVYIGVFACLMYIIWELGKIK